MSTVEASIETEGLTKRYGSRPVVRDITFRVSPGEVYALVGPNGAGKTTIIRLVSGLAFPSSGSVRLLGVDPFEKPAVRRQLGAVVEAPAAFYPYLTGRGNLKLHARLAGRCERQPHRRGVGFARAELRRGAQSRDLQPRDAAALGRRGGPADPARGAHSGRACERHGPLKFAPRPLGVARRGAQRYGGAAVDAPLRRGRGLLFAGRHRRGGRAHRRSGLVRAA